MNGAVVMKLTNIGFDGFTLKSTSYSSNSASERGLLKVQFTNPDVIVSKNTDDKANNIAMTFQVAMHGYPEGIDPSNEDAETAFEAGFVIETKFLDFNPDPMSEKEISESVWFFENFNQISTKLAVESIFRNSDISGISIPWTTKSSGSESD